MRCASCHHDVADGAFCVRCGARAGTADSRRRPFAAAPHERTFVPALVSTLFPQLPRARLGVFRLGLGAGTGLVLGLGIAGLYPAAVVAAALVVPTLLVIYLREVNIYEREPVRVLGLTAAWGIASGLLVGLLEARLAPNGVELAVSPSLRTVLVGGVLLPLVAYLSALAGPLVLLPYRRFNDVLDGVTFAVVSAAGFTGAQTLAQSWALFAAGPRPGGRRMPWLAHLFQLAIANPVLVACVSGVVAGTLWIRFRTPVRDRAATRLAARPVRTAVSAAALLVGVACLELMLPRNASVAVAATAAALALLALRRFVHLGLLQEAEEVPVGDDVTCANCGARTPSHTFCRACGVASHALPRAHALRHAGALLLVAGFALGIGSAGAAGAAVSAAVRTPPPAPPCSQERPCVAPRGAAALADTTLWRSSRLGYALEYGPDWRAATSGPAALTLDLEDRGRLEISGRAGSDVRAATADALRELRRRLPDLDPDRTDRTVPGAALGSRRATARAFCATATSPQGAHRRVDVVVLGATDGKAVAVVTLVSEGCRRPPADDAVYRSADSVLNTFLWIDELPG